jgi:hypothetical protein
VNRADRAPRRGWRDLIVIVAVLGFVLSRKRWVVRQPGAFRGAIRVTDGEIDGLRPKCGRGYGRWVRDTLVWTTALPDHGTVHAAMRDQSAAPAVRA